MATLIELAKRASEELKAGNPRTIATDTYSHNNRLIHELDAAIEQYKAAEPVYLQWVEHEGWLESSKEIYDTLPDEDRWLLYKHPAPAVPEVLLTEVHLINDAYKRIRESRVFAADDIEYDLFAAGWKECARLAAAPEYKEQV